jgi:hypothetical protein
LQVGTRALGPGLQKEELFEANSLFLSADRFLSAFAQSTAGVADFANLPGLVKGAQLCRLDSLEDFLRFSVQSTDLVFAGSSMIKVVIQLFRSPRKRPVVYYLDAHIYQIHFPFCELVGEALSDSGFGREFIE